MNTLYTFSSDHTRIAFDKAGQGETLILAHGFYGGRQLWHEFGLIEQLTSIFQVITLDFRGCGESDGHLDAASYTPELHTDDVLAVADACGCDTFYYWGWSFGATIGTHLATRSKRVKRAIIAGSYFGKLFTKLGLQKSLAELKPLERLKETGRLDEVNEQERAFVEKTNFPLLLARIHSLPNWSTISPSDLKCPTLVYTGTNDGDVYNKLHEQHDEIEAAGLELYTFADLNHLQLVSETELVIPKIKSFLKI